MAPGNMPCFCHYFRTIRMSRLILAILAVFFIVSVVSHYLLGRLEPNRSHFEDHSSDAVRRMLGLLDVEDPDSVSGPELKHRIEELLRYLNKSVYTILKKQIKSRPHP
jgi:hypothetical protein